MFSLYDYLPDDRTPEEVKILDAIMSDIYQMLDDPSDKFILAFCFHLGYGKEETARALGVSHVSVWKRIKKIQKLLEPIRDETDNEVKETDTKKID